MLLDISAGYDATIMQEYHFRENFKRLGFRGFCLHENTAYVVNSAALYQFEMNFTDVSAPLFTHIRTIRRPDWEAGERAGADLHHVYFSEKRNRIYVANSFMDCVDELSAEGSLLARKYLWEISPFVSEIAKNRDFRAADLVHINHIFEYDDYLYLTMGNINGTRKGCILAYETGEIVVDDLDFPHDGVVVDNSLYITNSTTSKVYIFENIGCYKLLGIMPNYVFKLEPGNPDWESGKQWIRGIAVTNDFIIVGTTQFRDNVKYFGCIPSRLIFVDRHTKRLVGEVFIPELDGFLRPCIYTIQVVEDKGKETIDFAKWQRIAPKPQVLSRPAEGGIADSRLRGYEAEVRRFKDWSWVPNADQVRVEVFDNTTLFQFGFAENDKAYLVTGKPKSIVRPPDDPKVHYIPPKTSVRMEILISDISNSGDVHFYTIQYDQSRKIRVQSIRLSQGLNVIRTITEENMASYRLAIRVAGKGKVGICAINTRIM